MTGTLTRPSSNLVLNYMRDCMGDGDDWGTAMMWAFGVAEVLYWHGHDVPAEMQFSPGMGAPSFDAEDGEWPDSEIYGLLKAEHVTVEDLHFAGRCLARYLDWLKAAGKSY